MLLRLAARDLGRLGGAKGGKARAASLSSERRVEIARLAAKARWKKEAEWKLIATDRIYRQKVASKLAKETGLDKGDLEHALFNQTLTPSERLMRGLACRS